MRHRWVAVAAVVSLPLVTAGCAGWLQGKNVNRDRATTTAAAVVDEFADVKQLASTMVQHMVSGNTGELWNMLSQSGQQSVLQVMTKEDWVRRHREYSLNSKMSDPVIQDVSVIPVYRTVGYVLNDKPVPSQTLNDVVRVTVRFKQYIPSLQKTSDVQATFHFAKQDGGVWKPIYSWITGFEGEWVNLSDPDPERSKEYYLGE